MGNDVEAELKRAIDRILQSRSQRKLIIAGPGIKGRYRRWLTPYVSADLDAGVMFRRRNFDAGGNVGITFGGAIGLADVIGLTMRVDVFDAGYGAESVAVAGVRIGAAPILTLVSLLAN